MERRRVVRVPASSANLGPGFDCFAAALALHLELEVAETGEFGVEADVDVPLDRSNLCVRGFEALHRPDDFAFRIRSQIPVSGGLGSSAAALVAGLVAADHLFELDADLQALGAALEGHPDNVGAALRGGFVVCADGQVDRFELPPELEAVVLAPGAGVPTGTARAALPAEVPLGDAVFNVSHAALLALGFARGDWELVRRGLDDRLHQPHRAALHPRSMELIRRARELGALGATLSGAGPAVLVWSHYEQTGALVDALRREARGDDVLVMRVPFEPQGADVRSL
jgi:homoserine kinase